MLVKCYSKAWKIDLPVPMPWTILTQQPWQSSTGGNVVQLKGSAQYSFSWLLHLKHLSLLPAVNSNIDLVSDRKLLFLMFTFTHSCTRRRRRRKATPRQSRERPRRPKRWRQKSLFSSSSHPHCSFLPTPSIFGFLEEEIKALCFFLVLSLQFPFSSRGRVKAKRRLNWASPSGHKGRKQSA